MLGHSKEYTGAPIEFSLRNGINDATSASTTSVVGDSRKAQAHNGAVNSPKTKITFARTNSSVHVPDYDVMDSIGDFLYQVKKLLQ